MKYNPFLDEYDRLKNSVTSAECEISSLTNDILWFDSVEISQLLFRLGHKEEAIIKFQRLLNRVAQEIEVLNNQIKRMENDMGSQLNPFNWFNHEQSDNRRKLDRLRKDLCTKMQHDSSARTSNKVFANEIELLQTEINRYRSYDRKIAEANLSLLKSDFSSLSHDLNKVAMSKSRVDVSLSPIIEQINDYNLSISRAKTDINKANSFEDRLNRAENSYERAMIHKECEKSLNEGAPKKIIDKNKLTINRLERDLKKAERRAELVGRKAARDIQKIVIDGNNTCYECDQFVGLSPLITMTNQLKSLHEVLVVFDAAIRSKMKSGDQAIRSSFDSSVQVHIVATKEIADETILDIASNDTHCYIVSNDRFGEFRDKEVIQSDRVIRHEVVSGKVIIHDLGVNSRYK